MNAQEFVVDGEGFCIARDDTDATASLGLFELIWSCYSLDAIKKSIAKS